METKEEELSVNSSNKDERLCLICGDRANGVHYNVLSCEGCKSFFLRSTKSKASFTCSQGGTCSMDMYTRRHCPACRMARCVELGMSVDRVWDEGRLKTRKQLIRIKRKKKQPSAVEPKRLATIPNMSASTCISSPSPPLVIPVATAPVMNPYIAPPDLATTMTTNVMCPNVMSPNIMSPNIMSPNIMSPNVMSPNVISPNVMSPSTDPILTSMSPLTPAPNEPLWELTEEQQGLLDRLERGYTASKEVCKNIFPKAPGSVPFPSTTQIDNDNFTTSDGPSTADTSTQVDDMAPYLSSTAASPVGDLVSLLPTGMTIKTALEALASGELTLPPGLNLGSLSGGLINSVLGSLKMPTSTQQQSQQQQQQDSPATSLDSNIQVSLQRMTSFITQGSMKDAAPQEKQKLPIHKDLLHTAMDMFAILVKQTIHFAKTIPGFMDLLCDDQAVLIKASIVDTILLRCAESYIPNMGIVFNEMTNDIFHINMMYQMGYTTLPEQAFQFMKETKKCGLATAEFALLNAISILSPDRTKLQNRQLVEEIQLSIVETLQVATKVYHPEDRTLFARLIMKLSKMRDIAVVHLSDLMEVQVQERDLSPLIVELFGLESANATS